MKTALVVGLGRMGARHAEAVRSLNLDLIAGVDSSEQSRDVARAVDTYAGARIFSDLDIALKELRPDLVCVATTAPGHAPATRLALQHQVPWILVEKPLANTVRDAEQLIQEVTSSPSVVAVNHQSRFLERYQYVRRLIGSLDYGDLRGLAVVGSDFGLAMNGIHFVEMFEWVCDEPIVKVRGEVAPSRHANPRGPEFEDHEGTLEAVTGRGRRLYIDCSGGVGHGIHMVWNFERGKVVWNELTGLGHASRRRPEDRELPSSRYGMPEVLEDVAFTVEDLPTGTQRVLESMSQGTSFTTLADATRAMRVLVGSVVSTEHDGKWYPVADVAPELGFMWA